jgi:hypothetical protein
MMSVPGHPEVWADDRTGRSWGSEMRGHARNRDAPCRALRRSRWRRAAVRSAGSDTAGCERRSIRTIILSKKSVDAAKPQERSSISATLARRSWLDVGGRGSIDPGSSAVAQRQIK